MLVWLYMLTAILAVVGGIGFRITYRKLDAREDEMNALKESSYQGRMSSNVLTVGAGQGQVQREVNQEEGQYPSWPPAFANH